MWQIAELYGVGEMTIQKNIKKYNIDKYERENKIKITELQHDMIIGNALGDGSFEMTSDNACKLRIVHSSKQQDYLKFKYNILMSLCGKRGVYIEKSRNIHEQDAYRFYTKSLNIFLKYRNMNIKDQIDALNINSLLIWAMDDGNLKEGKSLRIALKRFTLDEVNYTIHTITNKFNLTPRIRWRDKEKEKVETIIFLVDDTRKLMQLFKKSDFYEDVHRTMSYKFID